ncbi:MAG: hypothetical protein ACOX4M_02850 [Acetivibrionales bacterium]|jgi:hypothetical protein
MEKAMEYIKKDGAKAKVIKIDIEHLTGKARKPLCHFIELFWSCFYVCQLLILLTNWKTYGRILYK